MAGWGDERCGSCKIFVKADLLRIFRANFSGAYHWQVWGQGKKQELGSDQMRPRGAGPIGSNNPKLTNRVGEARATSRTFPRSWVGYAPGRTRFFFLRFEFSIYSFKGDFIWSDAVLVTIGHSTTIKECIQNFVFNFANSDRRPNHVSRHMSGQPNTFTGARRGWLEVLGLALV